MKGQNKKTLVVERASELFHQRGYMRVSLAEIAAASDMNQGNLYYYFKTKGELATAVLSHCDAVLKETFQSLEELSPMDRLRVFFDHIGKRATNYVEWGCPIAGLNIDMLLELGDEFHNEVPAVYQTYLGWFEQNLVQAGLPKKVASRESLLFLSGLQGAFHTAHLLKHQEVIPLFLKSLNARLDQIADSPERCL